jgi:hypothetical protein
MKIIHVSKNISVKIIKSNKKKKSLAILPDGKKLHFRKKYISKPKFWKKVYK